MVPEKISISDLLQREYKEIHDRYSLASAMGWEKNLVLKKMLHMNSLWNIINLLLSLCIRVIPGPDA